MAFKQEGIENMNAEEPSQKSLCCKQIKEDKVNYILAEENCRIKLQTRLEKKHMQKQFHFIIWVLILNNKTMTAIRINHL